MTVTGDAAWQLATDRIVASLRGQGGKDLHEGALAPPVGWVHAGTGEIGGPWASGGCVERLSRAYCASSGHDLALVLPLVMVGLSVAVQGSLVLQVDMGRGIKLDVPLVVQHIGLAESGSGKSTTLSWLERMIKPAMRAGVDERARWVEKIRAAGGPAPGADPAWDTLYGSALCPVSLLSSGTQEAIRNTLLEMGGHLGILAAEPDPLRETAAYSKDSGSVTLFLLGFDQDDLRVARVREGRMNIPEISLPLGLLLQPAPFTRLTESSQFVERGMFARCWLTQVLAPDLEPGGAGGAGEDEAAEELAAGMELAEAGACYADALEALAVRGSGYRAVKAVRSRWERDVTVRGATGLPVAGPDEASRQVLSLEPGETFARLQRLRQTVVSEVRVLGEDGEHLMPLALRLTSHALRWATLATLADAPGSVVVPAHVVEDTAVRVLPWLVEHWATVMSHYQQTVTSSLVADDLLRNRDFAELSVESAVFRGLAAMSLRYLDGSQIVGGVGVDESGLPVFTRREVVVRAYGSLSRVQRRAGSKQVLGEELDKLVADARFATISGLGPPNALGQRVPTIRLTVEGLARARQVFADPPW